MPITSSAKKALRQNIMRRDNNIKKRNALKALVKNYKKALVSKKENAAKDLLPRVYKALDKAAKTNIIKKKTADRLKSRLSRKLPK